MYIKEQKRAEHKPKWSYGAPKGPKQESGSPKGTQIKNGSPTGTQMGPTHEQIGSKIGTQTDPKQKRIPQWAQMGPNNRDPKRDLQAQKNQKKKNGCWDPGPQNPGFRILGGYVDQGSVAGFGPKSQGHQKSWKMDPVPVGPIFPYWPKGPFLGPTLLSRLGGAYLFRVII